MAGHLSFIAVGEIVIVGQLLTSSNVPHGEQIDPFVFFSRLAVGLARMINQRSHANTVDHCVAIREDEEISGRPLMVDPVGLLSPQASTGVFEDAFPFLDGTGRETSASVNCRRTDLKTSYGFKGLHVRSLILPVHDSVITRQYA